MAWQDNFNILYQSELPIDDTRTWRFALEEHKERGTLQLNVRIFKKTESYNGPTKAGFVYPVSSVEEVNALQVALNDYFEKVKSKF